MSSPVSAAPGSALRAAFDRLDTLPATWPLTGGGVCVVEHSGGTVLHTFGTRGPGDPTPVSPDDLFEIGSISKIFVGLAILQLEAEGRLDLDAPAATYLPWLAIGTPEAPVTVRHLLHHAGGLVKGADDPPDAPAQVWLLRHTHAGAPGRHFHYSNPGYGLLGLIVAALDGRSLAEATAERLLRPIGMTTAVGAIGPEVRRRLVTGTEPARPERPWTPDDGLAPAPWLEVDAGDGHIAASLHDMAAFGRFLLDRGAGVVPPALFARLTEEFAPGGEDWVEGFGLPVADSRYGLGINVERVGGHLCFSHGGGMVGYSSFVLADVDAGIAVVALTNANGDFAVGQAIARMVHAAVREPARPLPVTDLSRAAFHPAYDPAMCGLFAGHDGHTTVAISIREHDGRLETAGAGGEGVLHRTFGARFATDHPALHRFHLTFVAESGHWLWGPAVLRPGTAPAIAPRGPNARWKALAGRYRTYSPWYPTFRLVDREGDLVLIAPGGVEAADGDTPLVEIGEGLFRIGADPDAPERLRVGPTANDQVLWVERDGCRYSRTAFD
ncbi:serine hydrolase domain-containing protein [Segnochrobactrum spirostomi]|nr:serine hydrolase [Segnochrobactrum spirostomi]